MKRESSARVFMFIFNETEKYTLKEKSQNIIGNKMLYRIAWKNKNKKQKNQGRSGKTQKHQVKKMNLCHFECIKELSNSRLDTIIVPSDVRINSLFSLSLSLSSSLSIFLILILLLCFNLSHII